MSNQTKNLTSFLRKAKVIS
uniref:Uncharacterized protein n=1 Tax=Rhizophora mucronata TaxID=61149 RepID=A0A2P2QJG7_RHIMU